jgi:hypothetical protein
MIFEFSEEETVSTQSTLLSFLAIQVGRLIGDNLEKYENVVTGLPVSDHDHVRPETSRVCFVDTYSNYLFPACCRELTAWSSETTGR